MMEHIFTQEIGHTKGPAWGAASTDEYGQPNGQSTTIKARVEPSSKRVLTAAIGSTAPAMEDYQASFKVFTQAEVRVGDTLTIDGMDHRVATVAVQRDLGGREQFRQVVC